MADKGRCTIGKRGPKKTPTKILERRGSWRADARTKAGEPEPTGNMPECPDWLDADAHVEWNRIVVELEAMGIIGASDYAVLVGYCESWSQYKMAVEMIAKTGPLQLCETRRNPAVFILRDAREAMLKFARELGLSPSARASVSTIGGSDQSDPLAALLRKRGSLN